MRIAYITAGAAGMFCGSCMRDNTLASALIALGHDALLIPTYTPIRTDENDVSQSRVFFGGINVYLQEKFSLFRYTPRWFDRLLDFNWLLRFVSRFAVKTQASQLGDLTISMLQGELGHQAKEVDKLVDWLAADHRPQIVNLTNVILSGMVHRLRERLNVPILGSLQGDDIFLEMLPEPHKSKAIDLISKHCQEMQGFIATSRSYADFMSGYLRIPREKIDVVYPGINLKGHGSSFSARSVDGIARALNEERAVIGYLARICPEKGLHNLIDAFIRLRALGTPGKLRVSGWLGENNRAYFEEQKAKLANANLLADFEHIESPDHASKVRFLQSLDVLSVPTTYHEPKGLYVLEAWANGVPVVQPRHGSFPELIEATGGGVLVEPNDPDALALALRQMMEQPEERRRLGRLGYDAVHQRFDAATMARATMAVYERYVPAPVMH
ncbi:MAG: glycosyltransferase family 4 protein [Planctomycetes bacterium]|nr:glycosyltransferase family 4 protein [Planctomycetota bacterium]